MGQAPRRFRFTPRKLGPRERPRLGGLSFNRLLPNLLTMLGLCAGMTAIRFAIEARWEPAVTLIVVAAFIDGIDGRLARLLQATSRFGAEFDSLSDFLCFGVAPAFILFLWTLHDARGLGFIPCLLFAACMALRLARFNAAIDAPAAPGTVPRPAGFFDHFARVRRQWQRGKRSRFGEKIAKILIEAQINFSRSKCKL